MNSVSADTSTVSADKVTSSSVSWTGSANETWSVSVNGGATNQNVTNSYAQIGTGSSPSTSITFSTSGISGTITSIVVNCAAYQGKATVSATVGGSAFGTQSQSIPSWSSNTGGDVTFTGSASGAIVITMTNGSGGRAMYIKSITVTYSNSGGSTPTISVDPTTATTFTYVCGNGPSTAQTFSVSGANLTDNISLSLGNNSNFEMSTTAESGYTNSLTLNQTNGSVAATNVYVRLKAGLAKAANYSDAITLSSTGATAVTVDLSGSVTGQMYAISVENGITGGTIGADLESAEEGTSVTLTATPDAAYTFGSWSVYEDDLTTPVPVTNNQFTMPACEVYVTATFNAKPTYTVTCVADPDTGGTIEASTKSAYEGQTVTLSYLAETGYYLTSIVITKTSDGTDTGITPTLSGDDYTFTMPGYAVTATATFMSNTYEGKFVQYSGNLTEGDYILVYDDMAMNNNDTGTSNKLQYIGVAPSNNVISNPDKSIVWHIAASETTGYWTIYNEKSDKYVSGAANSTNLTLVDTESDNSAKWGVSVTSDTYDFRCKANENNSARYLRYYSSSHVYGNYASSNGGPLTLYKYTVMTERTITFNGNGGTYNNETTYTQTVNEGVATTLTANQFTHANSNMAFVGWSTTQNGSVEYADEASITVNADLTLYAQWSQLYTAMVDDEIANGTVKIVTSEGNEDIVAAVAGTEITLTYTASTGYVFDAWNVYKEDDPTTTVTVTNNKFTMPAYDVIVSANFVSTPTYTLATSITSGKHYIIASGTEGAVKAMGGQNSNNRAAVSVEAANGVIPETAGVRELIIYGPNASGYYTIYDSAEDGYLYAAGSGSGKNYLKTQSTNDLNGKWSIELDDDGGEATIIAKGENTNKSMRFNSQSSLFSCYANGQSSVYLFEKDGDSPVTTTASVKLNGNGYATFASTSALDFLDAAAAGFSAWQITEIDGETITFSQIDSHVKAGTGILLKGTANGTAKINLLPAGGKELDYNKLEGVTADKTIEAGQYYGLSGNQFVKVNGGTVPAGKALLPASEVDIQGGGSDSRLTFVFEDAQGIKTIEHSPFTIDDSVYNLSGQRVVTPKKGLYIVNGKKVVMK